MRRYLGSVVGVLVLLGAWIGTAQAAPLVSCGPSGYTPFDLLSRGFYLPNYPGNSLQSVALRLQGGASAAGTVTLTAHAGTYDGPLIGSSTLAVAGPISSAGLLTFVFAGNPPVSPGTTVAFSITAAGGVTGNSIFYSVFNSFSGDATCPAIETEATVAPLDTNRRQGVEIVLTGNSATLVSCGPSGYSVGDQIGRGFYLPNYPGNSLHSVALRLQGGASAAGTVTLTAHAGTFDGPLIGSSTLAVAGPISAASLLTFVFTGNPSVSPGTTVAFSITAAGGVTGNSIFYGVFNSFSGDPGCPVVETEGTVPPLDTNRRQGVEIVLTGGAPFLLASVNQLTFSLGQSLIAGGGVINRGLLPPADFFVGILNPGGSIQFFTPAGIVLGNVADLKSFRPLAAGVSLGTPFLVNAPNFYTHQWAASDLHGAYVFFVAAVVTGAVGTGSVTNDQILGLATAPFSFP